MPCDTNTFAYSTCDPRIHRGVSLTNDHVAQHASLTRHEVTCSSLVCMTDMHHNVKQAAPVIFARLRDILRALRSSVVRREDS
jgi:hypothetical protein